MAPSRKRLKLNRWQRLLTFALSALLVVFAPIHVNATPTQDMQRLDGYVEQAIAATQHNNLQQASVDFNHYKSDWFDVEDGVKETSRRAYKEIEDAMAEVKFNFSIETPDKTAVLQSLNQLHTLNQKFIAGELIDVSQDNPKNTHQTTISTLIEQLNQANRSIQQQDIAAALSDVQAVQNDWLTVEGIVATRSKQDYVNIENNLANASGFLKIAPPNVSASQKAIATLTQLLQPYAEEPAHYTLFDAALILLREGMEALLILTTLLAFLNKSGNSDKQHWLWIGTGAGILASIAVAIVIQTVFSNLTAGGANREVLEGATGLLAAVMLFYVSYWLHSKASISAWQTYIKQQATSAVANGSVFSLSLLAFLAVFREGGETVLFYIGIAPSISPVSLFGGLALATVLLVAIAFIILKIGVKIPLKPFFLISSLLIYYLGFRFVGSGIHALQVAGLLPANPATFLPAWDGLGLYPTWETTLPQLVLLVVTAVVIVYTHLQTRSKFA
ncbi:MAG TPA: FTR1 family protein [Crinalium sp.]